MGQKGQKHESICSTELRVTADCYLLTDNRELTIGGCLGFTIPRHAGHPRQQRAEHNTAACAAALNCKTGCKSWPFIRPHHSLRPTRHHPLAPASSCAEGSEPGLRLTAAAPGRCPIATTASVASPQISIAPVSLLALPSRARPRFAELTPRRLGLFSSCTCCLAAAYSCLECTVVSFHRLHPKEKAK